MQTLKSIIAVLVMATVLLVGSSIARAQPSASAPPTGNIAIRDGINPGEVVVSWDAVPEATHYRIGYVNMETDYLLAKSSVTGDWINAFIYVDENARNIQVFNGRAEYTIRRLEQGVYHEFTVLTSNHFVDTGGGGSVSSTFAWPPKGSRWEEHTVADRGGAPGPAPSFDFVGMYPNCDAVRAHYPGGVRRGSPIYRPALDRDGDGIACGPTDTTHQQPPVNPMDMIQSSSTSASANVQLTLTIASLPMDLFNGSSIVLYLEDDYKVPDSIERYTVYFRVPGSNSQRTNNGGRVFATYAVEIDDDDYFGGDDDWSIQVFVPDFDTRDVDAAEGFQGPQMGETLELVITKAAGIKNPSEAHDSKNTYEDGYKWSYAVLDPGASVPDASFDDTKDDLIVRSKISLSDPDNRRGYELTVFGSGFNNGTTAAVYVLHDPTGTPDCQRIINEGALAGHSVVGSDDMVAVTFEVTVPPFGPGRANYICMVDGEGRASVSDVEQFELQGSLRVVPSTANVGDTVTVFAQDFPNTGAAFVGATLAGRPASDATGTAVQSDGSATATFTVPTGVIGIVRVDAQWGGISKDTKIRIVP